MWCPGKPSFSQTHGWSGWICSTVNQTTEWSHLDVRRLVLAIIICVSSLGSSQCMSGAEGIFDYLPRRLQARSSCESTAFSWRGSHGCKPIATQALMQVGVAPPPKEALGKAATSSPTQVFQRPSVYHGSLHPPSPLVKALSSRLKPRT